MGRSEKFVRKLMTLSPEEFLGVAKLMRVELVEVIDEKPVPRDAAVIFGEIVDKFDEMPSAKQARMMMLMRRI